MVGKASRYSATRLLPGMKKIKLSRSSRRAFEGSTWTLVGYASHQLARLTTTVLLAHLLLGPKAFGLVALVNVFLSGLEMLSDLGVGLDVVQDPRGDDLGFLNTAFIIQAARGMMLAIVAATLAYPFAAFYRQPAVLWLLIVGAASIAIRGFTSSSVWTMTRHVQLKRLTLLTISGEIAGLLASLTWAIIAPGAWALVVGKVASALVFVVGTHMVATHPVSTRMGFSGGEAHPCFWHRDLFFDLDLLSDRRGRAPGGWQVRESGRTRLLFLSAHDLCGRYHWFCSNCQSGVFSLDCPSNQGR